MNRNTIMTVLVITALASIGYGIYRSTADKIIVASGTRETIYGEPQHGLILGLFIFAGICIVAVIAMVLDRKTNIRVEDREELSKRTL